jgi:hypothetical protein
MLNICGAQYQNSNNFYRKTQQDATVYQNLLFLILNEVQHVSGDTPPIIKEPKTAQAASGFANVEDCRTCSC